MADQVVDQKSYENHDNGEFQDLVDYVFELLDKYQASDLRKQKLEAARENRRRYDQETDKRRENFPFKNAVNVTLPLVTIAVDNIEPRMVAALAGTGDEVVRIKDIGEENPETEDLQKWWNIELVHVVKVPTVVRGIVHDILLDGTVLVMGSYTFHEEIRRDFKFVTVTEDGQEVTEDQLVLLQMAEQQGQPIPPMREEIARDEQGMPVTEDYIDPYFEGGEIEILDLEDVLMPDDAENWDEADIIRKVSIPYNKLRWLAQSGSPGWMGVDDSIFPESEEEDTTGAVDPGKDEGKQVRVHGRREVKCIEGHVSWNFLTKDERSAGKWDRDEKLIVLCTEHRRRLLRVIKQREVNFLNRKLIRRLRLFPEYGQSYGTAIASKLQQVQDAGSETFNLVLNSAWVCVIPWFFYTPDSGLTGEMELAPGKGVATPDPKGVVFPSFNVNPAQFIEFINMFFSLWERLSSVSDVQVGRTPEVTGRRAETATATLAQIQESQVKHAYTGTSLRDEFMEIVQLMYDLYYTHMPMERLWEQEGEKKIISKSAMRQKRKWVLTGSTDVANKYLDRKQAEDLFNLLKDVPIMNLPELIEDLLRKYDKPKPEDYIDPNVNIILKIYLADPQGFMQTVKEYVAMREVQAEAEGGGGEVPQEGTD